MVWLKKMKFMIIMSPQERKEITLLEIFDTPISQGCLFGLILPHVDIKKVKTCI